MRRVLARLNQTVGVPLWTLLLWALALFVVTAVDIAWAVGAA